MAVCVLMHVLFYDAELMWLTDQISVRYCLFLVACNMKTSEFKPDNCRLDNITKELLFSDILKQS